MRFGLIRRSYSPSGGAEAYLLRFARGLLDAGHEPVLLSGPAWPAAAWPHPERHLIHGDSPLAFSEALRRALPNISLDLTFSLERVTTCDVYRVGDGLHRAWLERLAAHGPPLAGWWRGRRRLHQELLALEDELFQAPHRLFIANSEMVRDEIFRAFPKVRGRVAVVPNGYDAPHYEADDRAAAREAVRQRHGIPPEAPIILFVGSGWKRKGAATLARAVRQLPRDLGAQLILVGKGRLPARLRSRPGLHCPGPLSPLGEYYLAADLFALPTLYDPFSNACLEAATHGLPVLTTTENGFHELFRDFPRAGAALSADSPPGTWRDHLATWLDPERREAAQADLGRIRERFTVAATVDATMQAVKNHVTRLSAEGGP